MKRSYMFSRNLHFLDIAHVGVDHLHLTLVLQLVTIVSIVSIYFYTLNFEKYEPHFLNKGFVLGTVSQC